MEHLKRICMISSFFVCFLNGKIKVVLFLFCFLLFSISIGQSSSLFDSDEVLELTLSGDIRSALKDRGDDPQYHPVSLQYTDGQETFDIPIRIKARGNFRKSISNCKTPPLFLNFKKSTIPDNSIFEGQKKTKLVTSCRGDDYVINEYLVYKLYNLISPKSFKARLIKIVYHDPEKDKSSKSTYGILLEEEKQMAERNQSDSFEKNGLLPENTEKEDFLKMAIFQYMIGNTDWSIQYQQNIKLTTVGAGSLPSPIPYDFDHAGIVRAPYAKPAAELKLTNTLRRRYRGYCIPEMDEFTKAFETFNGLKADFYAVYEGNPLIKDSYQKLTLKYLDEFYETINDPKKAKKEFNYPCDKSGTGNVVIKGLNK